jgi:nitroreductase
MTGQFKQDEIDLVDEVLSTARSVRRKLDFEKPVPRRVLLDCIDVAVQAPTGIAGENWRFLIVDSSAQKAAIAKIYTEILITLMEDRGMPMKPTHRALIDRLHEIPAMIFVCVDGLPLGDTVGSHVGYYGSILPAAWSLMLALRTRGLGSTWTTLLSAQQEAVKSILGMPEDAVQTVMLPVAYTLGAVLKRADRMPAESVTFANSWNQPIGE